MTILTAIARVLGFWGCLFGVALLGQSLATGYYWAKAKHKQAKLEHVQEAVQAQKATIDAISATAAAAQVAADKAVADKARADKARVAAEKALRQKWNTINQQNKAWADAPLPADVLDALR